MKKLSLKYVALTSFSIGLFVFAISAISNFLLLAFLPSVIGKLSILLITSFATGLLITFAIILLSPIFSDWVIVLRKLLRFDSLSHPLIQRLSYEAPGTYHHSINVSNLAQQAAKAINADALLVRIASYYHDIGKLYEPSTFIENQAGYEIPKVEDTEVIKETVEKIIAHVKKGVEIAETYNLPQDVTNLIAEHHGTTKVLYFFELAKEKKLKMKTTDFKYHGPVPMSKESAILMLADSIEAATRAIEGLNEEKIFQVIDNIMNDRIKTHQLKHSNLTQPEISKIKDSFIKTVQSIYHQRLNYKRDE